MVFGLVLVVFVTIRLSAIILFMFNNDSVGAIKSEESMQKLIMEDVLTISKGVQVKTQEADQLLDKLYKSADGINGIVGEIALGTHNMAENIQSQTEMTQSIQQAIDNDIDGKIEVPMAVRDQIGCTVDYSAGRNRYIGYLISLATRSYKNIKVGLDCANGSSWMIAKSVFDALGAKTYVINAEPDGLNINMNAGSTHIEVLQNFVKENQLDVGFAFDGDADRCIAIDENGNVVDGDLILYVYGRYLKEKGALRNNTVVTTIMSNFGLYKAFDELGIDYEKTQVGDKYVYENMVKNGHRIGGEQSGHIIFSKYATTGDGILTAIKMMEVMLEKKSSLATLTSPVRIYPQVLKNVRVKSKPEAQNDADVQAAVKQVAETLGSTGRILVRESGTEPVIRVMVEAETEEECEKYVDSVIDVIKEKGHCE